MTPARRNEVFERASALQNVTIDHAIERGRDYLVERLIDCRRRMDEAGQLAVEVKKAAFEAKVARRAAHGAYQLFKTPDARKEHAEAEDLLDELKALEQCMNVCRGTLRAADSDIRLAAALLDAQLKIGEVTPPPKDETLAPRVDISAVSDLPETGARLTEQNRAAVVNNAGANTVDLASLINDTSGVVTRPDSVTVESDEAISVEDLLR